MTAPSYCVIEGTTGVPPVRPDALCEAMGGLQFQDNVANPPRPNEHLSAKDFKQVEMLVQRLYRMTPLLTVEVTGTGSTHTLLSVTSATDALTSSNVTVTHNSTGTFTVAWPSGKLPAKTRKPHAYPTGSATTVVEAFPSQGTNSVQVVTANTTTGAPTNFTTTYAIDIYGE